LREAGNIDPNVLNTLSRAMGEDINTEELRRQLLTLSGTRSAVFVTIRFECYNEVLVERIKTAVATMHKRASVICEQRITRGLEGVSTQEYPALRPQPQRRRTVRNLWGLLPW